MENVLKLEDLPDTSPGVMDKLPVDVLVNLQAEAERHAAAAAQMLGVLHECFVRRYAAGVNDTGTTHRADGEYDITVTIPKRVDWSQPELAAAVAKLRDMGEDPTEYADTKLSVKESKYQAWPSALADLFTPARMVKAGKPTFAFKPAKKEAA